MNIYENRNISMEGRHLELEKVFPLENFQDMAELLFRILYSKTSFNGIGEQCYISPLKDIPFPGQEKYRIYDALESLANKLCGLVT